MMGGFSTNAIDQWLICGHVGALNTPKTAKYANLLTVTPNIHKCVFAFSYT